jgi:2-amino-4-hydroxy-6-hydroxymethyldihydropteridine diphosphokinase
MSASVYLLLGSNLGDRLQHLQFGQREISRLVGQIVTTSSVYKTAAWGEVQQPDFYNQVISINTLLKPVALLDLILAIEKEAGRIREEKWGPRTLDIDILFYDDQVVSSNRLTIPHPEIQNRKFTLLPLDEIAHGLIHPVLKKTVGQLLLDTRDELPVEKL